MPLKAKRSHKPSPGCPSGLGTTSTTSSCSAVRCNQAVLCLGTGHTHRGASPHRQPWHRLPWALLTSFLESRHDLDRTSSVLPLAWGVWLQSWSPLGLSSVLGAAVRNTSPTGRVMGEGRLCVTHLLD